MSTSFTQIAQSLDSNRILLVDSFNAAFRWRYKGIVPRDGLKELASSLARSYNTGTVYLLSDKGRSTFRTNIYPEYKAKRTAQREAQTEQEQAEFKDFFESYLDALKIAESKFPVFRFDGVEADDIAAYLVKQDEFEHYWLVSSDKDWDLLINEKCSRISLVTQKETTIDNFEDHYGIFVDQYLAFKVLQGDKGDNIPGVEGIGPKRALDILAKYYDIEQLLMNLPLKGTAKYIKNLNNSVDQLQLNVKLMDLLTYCDEALGEYKDAFN